MPQYLCPQCRLVRETVYLHHGTLYCALCLPDDASEDPVIRSRLTQIKARALREQIRAQRDRLAGITAAFKEHA